MRLKRITAFILSALLILINMTDIAYAVENQVYKIGVGEKVGIVNTNSPPKVMEVDDQSVAKLSWEIDTDNNYKIMVKGIKVGKTIASIQIEGETSVKTYSIEVIEGSTKPPISNGIQRINANKLEWTNVSQDNPLGGADDFSGIFFNEFKNFNETGGPIAAGKINNVDIITFEEKTTPAVNQFSDIVIPKFNVGAIAQNDISHVSKPNTQIHNGDGVIGKDVDSNKLGLDVGNSYKKQYEISSFMSEAKADLVNLNKNLWGMQKTVETKYTSGDIVLNVDKGINVFEVDFSLGRKNIKFIYEEDAKDSTIIIKVKGNLINYNDTFIGDNQFYSNNTDNLANRVIWTLDPAINGIELSKTILCGSLLAPNADIIFKDGYSAINGTIIANGLDTADGVSRSSEIHWVGPFMGKLGGEPVEKTGSFQFNKNDNHGKPVKGAKFALYQNEVEKYTVTSIETGVVSFNGIKEGSYTLKETIAPDGYEKSNEIVQVIVDNNGNVTFKSGGQVKELKDLDSLYVNNVIETKVDFNFNKILAGTDTGIEGIEFKLFKGDKEIATVVSDQNGVVSFKNIELGTYTLVETIQSGYEKAGPWNIEVSKAGATIDGKKLTQIENKKSVEKTGSFQFNKKDNYGKLVKGAEFTLYQGDTIKYKTATSTDIGLVSFNDIKEGSYTLKETIAPYGYEISKAKVEVIVDSKGIVTFNVDGKDKELGDLDKLYVNNITTVDFNFNKVIAGTKTGIPEVEFKLMQGDKVVTTAVSDERGKVSFSNIEIGSYKLVEITPNGYKAAGPWDIEITKNGAIFDGKELTQIENVEVIGAFKFNKIDNHGNPVKGAEFALYQDDEVKYTSTSTGSLSLKSIFSLYQFITRGSTEVSKGDVSFSGIKQGTYILKETKAPNGYEISKSEVEVTVNSDGTVTFKADGEDKSLSDLDLLYVNNVSKVDFSFDKVVSGTNTRIPNVEFKLMQGDKEIATVVSDKNGVVSFKNIELGSYTLVENTPDGYKETRPWTIDVTKEGAFIAGSKLDKIENEKIIEKTGSFKFNKKDNYENPVNGAKFSLYQDGVEKYTVISTDKGLVSFSDIKEGIYTLKETKAPNGYEISKSEVEVTVNNDGTVTFKKSGVVKTNEDLESLYINKMILGSISFTKYINDKKGTLAGAEFELLINGERYGVSEFSDINGVVTFLNVKPGEYTIREVSSHSKYFKASDKSVDIIIDENGVSTLVGEAKTEAETIFINKVENSIEFIKYSDSNSVLSNAIFELLKGTEVIATSISGKNGVVRFENILPGEYIVREKSAPKGYIKSEATKKIVVKDNGEISITASEIKEWEEAFKNKVYKSEVGSIDDNNTTNNSNNKDKVTVPKTSDEANIIFPVLAAFLSLAGIFLIRKIK